MKSVDASKTPEKFIIETSDGYPLTALKYHAEREVRGYLVIAGATGVPQLFYRHFAEFASAQGFTTLTFDYRGIGLSKPANLKNFRMAYLDWAYQDLAAAVDEMASDTHPLYMVGHSFGGHAFGLLPNHAKVSRFYTFATGAGWSGWMNPLERIRVFMMWNLIGPILTRLNGYLAWSKLGMGEDLPLGVYRDWKHWCRFPRYFFDDPSVPHITNRFNTVTTPIIAANALDDLWAPPVSRDAFMGGYRNVKWQGVDIDPKQTGLGAIGHMGYFRKQARQLWDAPIDWFKEHQQGELVQVKNL